MERGCSTGEEPYTLAMVLSEYAQTHPGFRFRFWPQTSRPPCWRRLCWNLTGRSGRLPCRRNQAEIFFAQPRSESIACGWCPSCAALVEFRRLNFMDADYGLAERPTPFSAAMSSSTSTGQRRKDSGKTSRYLAPDGYLFVGHAETLHDMNLPLNGGALSLQESR